MAKDLWQFIGVTYDNRLITVEEEIDRSFSRSDAERLCKSRNGFKEIRTSSPISRPLGKSNPKDSYRTTEAGGGVLKGFFWIFMILISLYTLIEYYIIICSIIGCFEGFIFGKYHLKKEKSVSNKFERICFCTSLMIAFGSIYGLLGFGFNEYKDQQAYLAFLPVGYLIIRLIWKMFSEQLGDNWEDNQHYERQLNNAKIKEEIEENVKTKKSTLESQLNEINELKNKELISEEEYKKMRERILGF